MTAINQVSNLVLLLKCLKLQPLHHYINHAYLILELTAINEWINN